MVSFVSGPLQGGPPCPSAGYPAGSPVSRRRLDPPGDDAGCPTGGRLPLAASSRPVSDLRVSLAINAVTFAVSAVLVGRFVVRRPAPAPTGGEVFAPVGGEGHLARAGSAGDYPGDLPRVLPDLRRRAGRALCGSARIRLSVGRLPVGQRRGRCCPGGPRPLAFQCRVIATRPRFRSPAWSPAYR